MDSTQVLEWSQKLNAFRRRSMSTMIECNLSSFRGDVISDYVPICIGDKEICDRAAAVFRDRLKDREGHRGPDTIQYHRRRNR
jgi:hypothetical protein